VVAYTARLRRAAGGVRLGIKIQYDRLTLELSEPDGLAVLIRQLKVRSLIADP